MADSTHDPQPEVASDERFGRTQWSQVLQAADPAAEGFAQAQS